MIPNIKVRVRQLSDSNEVSAAAMSDLSSSIEQFSSRKIKAKEFTIKNQVKVPLDWRKHHMPQQSLIAKQLAHYNRQLNSLIVCSEKAIEERKLNASELPIYQNSELVNLMKQCKYKPKSNRSKITTNFDWNLSGSMNNTLYTANSKFTKS